MRTAIFILCLVGCSPDESPPEAASTGTLTGTVTVSDLGSPLGALVVVAGRSALVGEDLTYTIPDVPSGEQTLRADLAGYESLAKTITVTAGDVTTENLQLLAQATENQAPLIASISASPPVIPPSGSTLVNVSAQDADGDTLSFTWSAPSGWAILGDTEQVTVTGPSTAGETGEVSVVVSDGQDTAEATILLTTVVSQNGAPVISSLWVTPPVMAPGDGALATVIATDPEGDPLTYTWTASTDFSVVGNSSTGTLQAPPTGSLQGTVTVEVSDGNQTATAVATISTADNEPPVVGDILAEPLILDPGGSSTLTVTATDPEGGLVLFDWSASAGWTVEGDEGTATVTAPDTVDTAGVITVTAGDDVGAFAQRSIQLATRPNQSPVLSALTASPLLAAPGATIDLTVTASDPDGHPLTAVWSTSAGTLTPTDLTATLTLPDTHDAVVDVSVTVEDGSGGSTTGTLQVGTLPNQDPVISGVTATPQPAAPAAPVSVSVTASDPEGGALSYEWIGPNTWTLVENDDSATITPPDEYGLAETFTVTVKDSSGGSATQTFLLQTALNSPPQIQSLTALPVPAPRGETIDLSVVATDPDGDPLDIVWTGPDGGWGLLTPSDDTATLVASETAGLTDTVSVQVSDGDLSVTGTVAVTTATNQPPQIDAITVDAVPALPGDTVVLTATASDPDGGAGDLTYSWESDDSGFAITVPDTSLTTVTPPDLFGQSATLTLTVTDPDGATATSGVIVSTRSCPAGKGDCDGDTSNGCEADLYADVLNCGTCGQSCGGGDAHSSPSCNDGSCEVDCNDDAVSLDSGCQTCGAERVLADAPVHFWRLGALQTVATDSQELADLTHEGGVFTNIAGVSSDGDPAVGYSGGLSASTGSLPAGDMSHVTLELWARSAGDSSETLLSYANTQSDAAMMLSDPTALTWTIRDATMVTGPDISDGQWHHIVASWDTTGAASLTVDGSLAGTSTGFVGQTLAGAGTLALAQAQSGGAFVADAGFSGQLDEVALYDRALTESEILDHITTMVCDGNPQCLQGSEACPAPSCLALFDAGVTADGQYWVDGGAGAVKVQCDMTGGGWTAIDHDWSSTRWYSQGCEDPYCSTLTLTYDGDAGAVLALVATANSVRQELLKECRGSIVTDNTDYLSLGGVFVPWPSSGACNLDDAEWRFDGGEITDPDLLPVWQIRNGDVSDLDEEAYFTVGPLWLR